MSIGISYPVTEDHVNKTTYNTDKSTMCSIMVPTVTET